MRFLLLSVSLLLFAPVSASQTFSGRALRFDGVDDRVIIRPSDTLPGATFTALVWVRLEGAPNGGATILSRRDGRGAACELLVDPEGMPVLHLADGRGPEAFLSTGVVLDDGDWHQVAATRRADEVVQLFVDGEEVGTFGFSPTPTVARRTPLAFGATGEAGFLRGWIGEVVLWGRALSAEELRAVRYGAIDERDPELRAHWTFGSRGQSVFDSSRRRQDGFLGTSREVDAADPVRVSVRATAEATVREGHGINPRNLTTERLPVLGQPWSARLDCAGHAPDSPALLFAYGAPLEDVFLGVGELLVDPRTPMVFLFVETHASGPVAFEGRIPRDPALTGRGIFLQGLCGGRPGYQLSNALDLTLGFAPDPGFVEER